MGASESQYHMHASIDSWAVQLVTGWHLKKSCFLSRPDDLAISSIPYGWLMANVIFHPDCIRSFSMSSGWRNISWTLSHPDDLAIGSNPDDLAILSISSGWLMDIAGCHPYDLLYYPIWPRRHIVIWTLSHPDELNTGSISSGWLMANVICHPDDIRSFPKSYEWHSVF